MTPDNHETLPQAPIEVINSISNGTNNFVSTLDHLPCDLTRSLWFIQMMNLRSKRLELQLNDLANDEGKILEINKIIKLILKYQTEAERESKYVMEILNDHFNYLNDDRDIMSLLKTKLKGWTSDAVEKRWIEWGKFKREFLQNRKNEIETNDDLNSIFNNFKIVENIRAPRNKENNGKNVTSRPKQVKEKPTTTTTTTTPTDNSKDDLKIKISLKRKHEDTDNNSNPLVKKLKFSKNSAKIILKVSSSPSNVTPKTVPVVPLGENNVRLSTDSIKSNQENIPIKPTITEEVYCFCRGSSFGKMVACEYEKCPYEWFHFKCVGLTKEPEGEWFCSNNCKENHQSAIERKLKRAKNKSKRRNW